MVASLLFLAAGAAILLFDPAGFALATLAAADFAALLLDAVALAPLLFAARRPGAPFRLQPARLATEAPPIATPASGFWRECVGAEAPASAIPTFEISRQRAPRWHAACRPNPPILAFLPEGKDVLVSSCVNGARSKRAQVGGARLGPQIRG